MVSRLCPVIAHKQVENMLQVLALSCKGETKKLAVFIYSSFHILSDVHLVLLWTQSSFSGNLMEHFLFELLLAGMKGQGWSHCTKLSVHWNRNIPYKCNIQLLVSSISCLLYISLCLVYDDNLALNLHEFGYDKMGGYSIFQNGLPLVFHFVMKRIVFCQWFIAGVVDRALYSHLLSSGFTFGCQLKCLVSRVRAGVAGAMPCCCNSYRG